MRETTCLDCGALIVKVGGGRIASRCKPCAAEDQRQKNIARGRRVREERRKARVPRPLACVDCGVSLGLAPVQGRPKERCEPCRKARTRVQYRKDYEKHGDRRRALNLAAHYRKKYGITVEDRDRMLDLQGGLCAICGGRPNGNPNKKGARLHVDHCHTTNKIRGLLCYSCNTLLGIAKDSPERLEAAAEYLRKHT